jgi:hypothetical protein
MFLRLDLTPQRTNNFMGLSLKQFHEIEGWATKNKNTNVPPVVRLARCQSQVKRDYCELTILLRLTNLGCSIILRIVLLLRIDLSS